MAHSGKEFIVCVDSYQAAHFGKVCRRDSRVCGELLQRAMCDSPQRIYRGCSKLSHRTLWHNLAENLYVVWRYITQYSVAQFGRVFLGFVESYHTAHCGTVFQRVYLGCRELLHIKLWHSQAEIL